MGSPIFANRYYTVVVGEDKRGELEYHVINTQHGVVEHCTSEFPLALRVAEQLCLQVEGKVWFQHRQQLKEATAEARLPGEATNDGDQSIN